MNVATQLRRAAELNEQRDGVYGDSHERLAAVLAALFPAGVRLQTVHDHARFSLLVSIISKITRYCVAWDRKPLDPDHMRDLSVYAAMLEATDERDHRTQ